jgi:hypothetical protein
VLAVPFSHAPTLLIFTHALPTPYSKLQTPIQPVDVALLIKIGPPPGTTPPLDVDDGFYGDSDESGERSGDEPVDKEDPFWS